MGFSEFCRDLPKNYTIETLTHLMIKHNIKWNTFWYEGNPYPVEIRIVKLDVSKLIFGMNDKKTLSEIVQFVSTIWDNNDEIHVEDVLTISWLLWDIFILKKEESSLGNVKIEIKELTGEDFDELIFNFLNANPIYYGRKFVGR